ncbi:hypothetical protein [Cupriavidus sp. BIS7]|uniref:hypothetical protein n=1 Tax=Cupriavidus sp. BIS7 TaxID=1217718 RepID=UPI0003730BFA|nr:hypothetical protein [Cupriavidus sp. BIS7]
MKKTLAAVAVILTLGASTAANAVVSFGNTDCGTWINKSSPAQRVWLNGYMSALNAIMYAKIGRDALKPIQSAEQLHAWMDNYCRAHPLKMVDEGAFMLLDELLTSAGK